MGISEHSGKKLPPLIQHLVDAIENKNMRMTFGIQPEHIKLIESELERWDSPMVKTEAGKDHTMLYSKAFWDSVGKKVGWCPFTLCLAYMEKQQSLKTK